MQQTKDKLQLDKSPARISKLKEQESGLVMLYGPVEMKKIGEQRPPNFKDKEHNVHYDKTAKLYMTTYEREQKLNAYQGENAEPRRAKAYK